MAGSGGSRRGKAAPGKWVWIGGAAALVLAIALGAAGVGYWLWQSEPDYWHEAQEFYASVNGEELDKMAEAVQNRTVTRLSNTPAATNERNAADDGSADGVQTVHLSYRQMNAWLAQRLEGWLEYQDLAMPDAIERPVLGRTRRGELVLAFRARLPEWSQVMSIVFDVEVLEDGRARLDWQRTRAGRLPLPNQWVKQQVVDHAAAEAGASANDAGVLALHEVLDGAPFEPLIPVDGARHARVVDVDVGEQGVDVTVRLEPRPQSRAAAPARLPATQ